MWAKQCHKPVVSQSQKNPINHWILIDINGIMAIHVGKTNSCLPSPSHHHVYRWYIYHFNIWVVYDIVLATLQHITAICLLIIVILIAITIPYYTYYLIVILIPTTLW